MKQFGKHTPESKQAVIDKFGKEKAERMFKATANVIKRIIALQKQYASK